LGTLEKGKGRESDKGREGGGIIERRMREGKDGGRKGGVGEKDKRER